jgi:hypothetical protein
VHGRQVGRAVGAPIDGGEIRARGGDSNATMDFLRKATYELSPTPLESRAYGFEFGQRHRA